MEEKPTKEIKGNGIPMPKAYIPIKVVDAKDQLQNFIEYLASDKPLMDKAKTFLTKTQQFDCNFVGRQSVEGAINGLHQLIKMSDMYTITQKVSTNKIAKDCVVKFRNKNQKAEIQIKLIKETDVRKPGETGQWGVNAFSFKKV